MHQMHAVTPKSDGSASFPRRASALAISKKWPLSVRAAWVSVHRAQSSHSSLGMGEGVRCCCWLRINLCLVGGIRQDTREDYYGDDEKSAPLAHYTSPCNFRRQRPGMSPSSGNPPDEAGSLPLNRAACASQDTTSPRHGYVFEKTYR